MTSLAYKLRPQREETPVVNQPLVRPRRAPQTHEAARRETAPISPAAIAGFALVCVMIVLILFSHIQLDQVNSQEAALTTELAALQKDYEDLSSQYEQVFDMESIKTTLTTSGSMVQLTPEQQTYMDLSCPDNAVVYEDAAPERVLPLSTMFSQVVEFFR